LFLVSVLVIAFGLSQQINAATIGDWRFEVGSPGSTATGFNTVLDSSGNNFNGTPFNGPTYSANVPPPANQGADLLSMQFNGSNQRVFVPDSSMLQLTQSLTIEAFIYAHPLQDGEIGGDILVRSDDRSGFDPYRLHG